MKKYNMKIKTKEGKFEYEKEDLTDEELYLRRQKYCEKIKMKKLELINKKEGE